MRFGGIDGGLKVGSMVVERSTPSLSPPRRCWRIKDRGTAVVDVGGEVSTTQETSVVEGFEI